MVNERRVVEEPLATAEASTSAEGQACVDGGKVAQAEVVAKDVDAGAAHVTK
jgi:hypothetical protein